MAVEVTPLGFRKPDGKELVRNVDNEISHNAQKAQDYLGQLLPDVDALKTLGGLQPGDVSDATMTTLANDPNSNFRGALSATIVEGTTAVSAEIPKTYGAVVSPGAVELPVLHRHNAFPGLARLADGRWIGAWRGAWDHEATNDGVLVVSFSADGVNWPDPTVVDTNVATLGEARDPSITVTASGEVLLVFYARGVQRSHLIRSTDNGATWTAPAGLPFPAGLAFAGAPITILPSGRWLVAAYNGDATAKTIVMRSDDQGATWSSVTLTPVNPLAGFLEPNLISLGGTNVLMLIRAQTGRQIYKTTSTDGGATWGTVTEAFFGTNNPHMIRWASGTISTFYRHPFHGGFMIRSSFDDGATWTRAFHVAQSKTFMGNAIAVELPETPGQALILWASEDNGPSSLATSTLSESGGVSRFGPIPHPAFEATRSRIADTMWLPASWFTPVAGGPSIGNVATHPGWLMDAASSEAVAITTGIPPEWERFSVIVSGVSTDTNLGTVVWDASYNQFGDTSNLTSGTFVNGPGIGFFEGVVGDVRPQTILSNLTPTERMVWQFRIIRDAVNASDTYPSDVLFLGVELRRTK